MSQSEYRSEASTVAKETSWTIWRFLPVFLLVVIILTIGGWALKSAGIIGMDIEREVVQHSRQFVDSKQAKLQNLYTKYTNLQTKAIEASMAGATKAMEAMESQQMAILSQMKREAMNIPSHKVPLEVQRLIQ